jgi:hypothetical protein
MKHAFKYAVRCVKEEGIFIGDFVGRITGGSRPEIAGNPRWQPHPDLLLRYRRALLVGWWLVRLRAYTKIPLSLWEREASPA